VQEISPLDGRYRDRVGHLGRYFSERALMASRVRVEVAWLLALDEVGLWPSLSDEERARAARAAEGLTAEQFGRIKEIERTTRHDVKACERWLRETLDLSHPARIHFGLTSEDVNNLAWSLLLAACLEEALLPALGRLVRRLTDLGSAWAEVPLPTRTHGQRATPSTAGKELAVFAYRLARQGEALCDLRLTGKCNGATGTYAALLAAAPEHDWVGTCEGLVRDLGLEPAPITTQIEDHDRWAELLDRVRRVANIVLDLDRDVWLYLAFGLLRERTAAGEIGSSTMPHKVNPIRFENSEGNLELAVPLLAALADKLCRSRLQRDLSDSTATRNLGVPLGHVLLALEETTSGLGRLEVDAARCRAELEESPELLAEPIQTILRASGAGGDPYELLREHTRGREVRREDLVALVDGLPVSEGVKERVRALAVPEYVGAAPAQCRRALTLVREGFLARLAKEGGA